MPPGLNAAAISGEYLSAASFLGIAGLIVSQGLGALWYSVGYTAGYLVLLLLVAAPLRRFGAYTIPDFAEGRFAVAGPLYPATVEWPGNVERLEHLAPAEHRGFYNRQRFTLNVTRADMVRAGYSPSVRLFEAAACATPIISDNWPGLGTFFRIGEEILTAKTPGEVLQYLRDIPEHERRALGERARARVLREHTAAHRAEELEGYALRLLGSRVAA